MDAQRHLDTIEAVNKIAELDGERAGVRHVCLACGIRTNAIGVAVYLLASGGAAHPLETTGQVGQEIAELQLTVGEGPLRDALRHNQPVLVPHLDDSASAERWPVFTPAAMAAGVAAVFAIPLTLGAISLGVLEICRDTGCALAPDELTDVLLYADVAITLMLDQPGIEPEQRWGLVNQAAGMVSVQLGTDIGEAFIRLRAHSYLTGRRLSEVATDVVARGLRFTPNEKWR
ncbi:hypothetical protein Lesp02_15160 [Lentzea sp. NBRC 105346]|uniref:ANTAR domain-containing protein n=1 Tax=Lentzea sp. NBRC 105346 TaxID=3032205 RepID=UPI0024A23667|nr:ANTAR domain-containing protein [Lentzea sp. NBRC 105346]GLZ29326.1 hypothetical protein Lesp02_15160 [Lentzea sp. NBRC 105346]